MVYDSMISGLMKNLLSKNVSIRVIFFTGGTVDNIFFNVMPVLKKNYLNT